MTDLYDIGSNDSLLAGLEPALKISYTDVEIKKQTYDGHPLLGMLEKKEDVRGLVFTLPITVAPETGASHTFTDAQTYANSFLPEAFQVQTANDYVVANITNKLMLSSQGDAAAFLDLAKGKIDFSMDMATRRLSLGNYRSTTGQIGQIGSISSAGVVQMADRGQVVAIERGMVLQATADLVTLRTLGYVVGVDRGAGTFTISATRGGTGANPGSWAQNDYLVPKGDLNLGQHGLDDLIPTTLTDANKTLWGVDRSIDRQRLAGTYLDASTGSSVQDALVNLLQLVCETGVGHPTHIFTNYVSFGALLKDVNAKVQNPREVSEKAKGKDGATIDVSYSGIELFCPTGRVVVIPDRDCLPKTAFALDMKNIKLASIGPATRVLSPDGLKWLRQGTADGAEVRIGGYYQIVIPAPAAHGRVALPF